MRVAAATMPLQRRSDPIWWPGRVRSVREPVLEGPFHARVEGVEAVERECLGRAEPSPGRRWSPVVTEHAMQQRQSPGLVEASGALGQDPMPDRDVAQQSALLAQPNLSAVGER